MYNPMKNTIENVAVRQRHNKTEKKAYQPDIESPFYKHPPSWDTKCISSFKRLPSFLPSFFL